MSTMDKHPKQLDKDQLPWSVWVISTLLLLIYAAQSMTGETQQYLLDPSLNSPFWTAYTTQFMHAFGLHVAMNIITIIYFQPYCFESNREALAFYAFMPLIVALPLYLFMDTAVLGYSTITAALIAVFSLKSQIFFLSISLRILGISFLLEMLFKGQISHMAHFIGWCAGVVYWAADESIKEIASLRCNR
jgi:membrane associated rhomboid family serine protease